MKLFFNHFSVLDDGSTSPPNKFDPSELLLPNTHVADTSSIPTPCSPPRPTVKLSQPEPSHTPTVLAMAAVSPPPLPVSHPIKHWIWWNGRLMWVNTVDPWSICWIKAVVNGSDNEHAYKHLHSFVHDLCIDEVDASLLTDLHALSPDDTHWILHDLQHCPCFVCCVASSSTSLELSATIITNDFQEF